MKKSSDYFYVSGVKIYDFLFGTFNVIFSILLKVCKNFKAFSGIFSTTLTLIDMTLWPTILVFWASYGPWTCKDTEQRHVMWICCFVPCSHDMIGNHLSTTALFVVITWRANNEVTCWTPNSFVFPCRELLIFGFQLASISYYIQSLLSSPKR